MGNVLCVFSSAGRLNRRKYFWFSLANLVLYWLFIVGLAALLKRPVEDNIVRTSLYISTIVTTAIQMCLGIRRLHDMDHSGHYYWLVLVPVINLALALMLLFRKGTDGPNEYDDYSTETEIRTLETANKSQEDL